MYVMIFDDKQNFVWSEVPDPVRKEGEVLIDVHAAAVNRADLMQKDGCYASPPDWPQWCGLEVSGVVLEAPTRRSSPETRCAPCSTAAAIRRRLRFRREWSFRFRRGSR